MVNKELNYKKFDRVSSKTSISSQIKKLLKIKPYTINQLTDKTNISLRSIRYVIDALRKEKILITKKVYGNTYYGLSKAGREKKINYKVFEKKDDS